MKWTLKDGSVSAWGSLRDFFNETNGAISLSSLHDDIFDCQFRIETISHYCSILTMAGFLRRVSLGVYKRKRKIPKRLTRDKVYQMACSQDNIVCPHCGGKLV